VEILEILNITYVSTEIVLIQEHIQVMFVPFIHCFILVMLENLALKSNKYEKNLYM